VLRRPVESAQFRVHAPHQGEHLVRRRGVQVAGGFIGQHQGGLQHHGPCDGHPLLHATRQFARAFVHGLTQADRVQHGPGLVALPGGHPALAHQGRQGHVLQRSERRQQVVELEHKAQRGATAQRQGLVIDPHHLFAFDPVAARGHALEQAQDVQQGALARPGGTDEGHQFTAGDVERHAVQHLRLVGQADVVAFADRAELQQRR
jgi:hypothetical protein